METSQKLVTESMFTQKLRWALRSMGLLCPVTPEQVKVFESKGNSKRELHALLTDPIAMLDRGYIGPSVAKTILKTQQPQTIRYAARKGDHISDETWQLMENDRLKALEAKNKK